MRYIPNFKMPYEEDDPGKRFIIGDVIYIGEKDRTVMMKAGITFSSDLVFDKIPWRVTYTSGMKQGVYGVRSNINIITKRQKPKIYSQPFITQTKSPYLVRDVLRPYSKQGIPLYV